MKLLSLAATAAILACAAPSSISTASAQGIDLSIVAVATPRFAQLPTITPQGYLRLNGEFNRWRCRAPHLQQRKRRLHRKRKPLLRESPNRQGLRPNKLFFLR